MAIDAVPTRWYLSGLEVERGLSISVDTAFFAHRAAAAHNHLRGSVFLVPQFGLMSSSDKEENSSGAAADEVRETVADLNLARHERKIKNLAAFENTCDEDDIPGGDSRLAVSVESIWWAESHHLIATSETEKEKGGTDTARRVAALEDLERAVLDLGTETEDGGEENDLDGSPLVLTDNLGPHEGIRTNEIAREVEAFGGLRCWNGIRLRQLAILGYSLDALAGAFALSSEFSRKAAASGQLDGDDAANNDRCDVCSMFRKEEVQDIPSNIAKLEIKRAAKTAILWAESLGV